MIRSAIRSLILLAGFTSADAAPFYKEPTLFGPVGMAIELHQPTFTLWADAVEPGSPADSVLRKAATFVPMPTSAWQELQNPQNPPSDPEEGKFGYEGKLVPNPKIAGSWTTVALVKSAAEFDPKAKPRPDRSPIRDITLNEDGASNNSRWIWSGATLMDLETYAAHKITPQAMNGTGWQPQLMVLKRN